MVLCATLCVSYLLSTGFLSGDGLDAREPAVNKTDTVPVLVGLSINSRTCSQNLSPPYLFRVGPSSFLSPRAAPCRALLRSKLHLSCQTSGWGGGRPSIFRVCIDLPTLGFILSLRSF